MTSIFQSIPHITQNTAIKLSSEIVGRIASFGMVILAARLLSESEFGLYNYGVALGFVLAQLGDMGLQTVLTREVAVHGKATRPSVIQALQLKALLSPFVLLVLWVVISQQPLEHRPTLYIFGMMLLTQTYLEFAAYIFRGQQLITKESQLLTAARLLTAVTGGILLWRGGTVLGLAITGWLSMLTLTGVAFWQLHQAEWLTGWQWFTGDQARYHELIKQAAPLGIAIFMSIAYTRLAVLLLQYMMGATAVAHYSAAIRLIEPTQIVPASLMAAVFPVVSLAWRQNRPQALKLSWRVSGVLAFLGVGIAMVYLLSANWLLPFLYGSEYVASIAVFQVSALTIVPAYINYSLTHYLIARGQQAYIGWFNGIVLVIHMLLCWVLISKIGVVGPAISVLIAELFLLTACLIVLRFRVPAPEEATILRYE